MANQYSITVSDRANATLKWLKTEKNMMPSRVISALIDIIGTEGCMSMYQLTHDPKQINNKYDLMMKEKEEQRKAIAVQSWERSKRITKEFEEEQE